MARRKKRDFSLPEGLRQTANRRPARVADAIRRELILLFQREIRDPRIAMVRITGVRMSPDLRQAAVYYTCDEGARDAAGRGLEQARGFIRSHLARVLNMRYTPVIVFRVDRLVDENERLDRILHEIGRGVD